MNGVYFEEFVNIKEKILKDYGDGKIKREEVERLLKANHELFVGGLSANYVYTECSEEEYRVYRKKADLTLKSALSIIKIF